MKTLNLFTFILEFRGGTYASQVHSSALLDAIGTWTTILSEKDLAYWKLTRPELQIFVKEQAPIALDGLSNVWCISGTIADHFALLNIINTRHV